MNTTNKWIAALAVGLATAAGSLAAHAQDCDAAALTCFASGAPGTAGDLSFQDLVRAGDVRPAGPAALHDAYPQPAVYSPQGAAPASAVAMAPAGVGAIDSAMGTEIDNPGVPAWLAVPRSIAAPDSSIAWIFGFGFLGYVILRRVRAAPNY
jgi:hypothetical protein